MTVEDGEVRWDTRPELARRLDLLHELAQVANLLAVDAAELPERIQRLLAGDGEPAEVRDAAVGALCRLSPERVLEGVLGLTATRDASGVYVEGELGGCRVSGSVGEVTTFEVAHPDARVDVHLGVESRLRAMWEGSDARIGDPEFDDAVRLAGPEPWLRAVLDQEFRSVVRDLVTRGVEVVSGRVRCADATPATVMRLRSLADLGARMALPADAVPERLQAVLYDPAEPSAVRRGAARALCSLEPAAAAELPEQLLVGLLDTPSLQEVALDQLGERGSADTIEPITRATTGLWVSRGLREAGARAVAAIEARTGSERGRLSVVTEGGELSPVPEGGGLSESEGSS